MGSRFCAHRAERRLEQSQVPWPAEARQQGAAPQAGRGDGTHT